MTLRQASFSRICTCSHRYSILSPRATTNNQDVMMLKQTVLTIPQRGFHLYKNKIWTETHKPSTFIHINKYEVMSTYSGDNKSTRRGQMTPKQDLPLNVPFQVMSTNSGDKKTAGRRTTKARPDQDHTKLNPDIPINVAMLYYTDDVDPNHYSLIYRNKKSRYLTLPVLGCWFSFLSFYIVQGFYFWWPYMGKMMGVNDDAVMPILGMSASAITLSMSWKIYVWQCLRIYKAVSVTQYTFSRLASAIFSLDILSISSISFINIFFIFYQKTLSSLIIPDRKNQQSI